MQAGKARKGKEGTRIVKEAGTYFVVRELHLEVEDEGVREGCERLVDVLMGDDDEGGERKGDERVKDLEDTNGRVNATDDEDEDEVTVVEIF